MVFGNLLATTLADTLIREPLAEPENDPSPFSGKTTVRPQARKF